MPTSKTATDPLPVDDDDDDDEETDESTDDEPKTVTSNDVGEQTDGSPQADK